MSRRRRAARHRSTEPSDAPSPLPALGCVALGVLSVTLAIESVLESPALFANFGGPTLHAMFLGESASQPGGDAVADVSFVTLLVLVAVTAGMTLFGGAALLARKSGTSFSTILAEWGITGWRWWWMLGAWELLRLFAFGSGLTSVETFLAATPQFWFAFALAGWGATFSSRWCAKAASDVGDSEDVVGHPYPLFGAVALAVVTFTWMNWGLSWNLLVPHGDSAMYEEHLWNVAHGKGFRSYLDRGLFLGEHIQVIHLALLPLHLVWPSLLPLEFAESLALFSSVLPVYWIARRHGADARSATLLAIACLLYFPLHYLDVAIDLKTFRPISFGVPLVLFGLDQLERRNIGAMLLLFALALAAKEDFAIVLAPLGVWWAWDAWRRAGATEGDAPRTSPRWRVAVPGFLLAAFATAYLLFVVKYAIPWFRDGVEVHYVGYFSRFGDSLNEVARNLLFNPGLLIEALFVPKTFFYAVAILVPLAGLPLRSPTRLLTGLPLFGLLCLNELAADPRHHFHAPLVPIVFWSAAAGLSSGSRDAHCLRFRGTLALGCALLTGACIGFSPLSVSFWEPGSPRYWRTHYVPDDRARAFDGIAEAIPRTARVFSTDFVHPRFTHHERSYDYSGYPRPSDAELEQPLPGETYYLVIDTGHRYSDVKRPEDVPEYASHPEQWELVDALTNEWFLVFRRRRP